MQTGQKDAELVILLAEGGKDMSVFWEKTLDRLVCIPKNIGTRTRTLNDFVSICLEQQDDGTLGFQLQAFALFAPRIWEMLGCAKEDRVRLGEILHYYEGVTLGRIGQRGLNEVEAQVGHMRDLRDLFGHITIFQPEHARTIPL